MPINFNPAQVMFGGQSSPIMGGSTRPYLPTSPKPVANPMKPTQAQPTSNGAPYGSVNPAAVRATGTGPYDSAYRQNLATYAGGQFANPTGLLSFNPTDPNAFANGTPPTQIENALGGGGFSWTPQAPQPAQTQSTQPSNYWKFWLNQFNRPMSFLRESKNAY